MTDPATVARVAEAIDGALPMRVILAPWQLEDLAIAALAAAAREGGDVKQAPGETPQSGGKAVTPNPLSNPFSPSRGNEDAQSPTLT
jgi:hypothetical protein